MAEFKGKRYITSGIENKIPVDLQIAMWDMIDEARQQEKVLDYLQIFILRSVYENGTQVQEIVHKQEQPWRSKKITIESDSPVAAKIFVIDNESYVTMLLNHEY